MRNICKTLLWVVLANTAVWAVEMVVLGGSAMGHTVVNGHYFLTAKSSTTEVSKFVFNISF
jgi:hypothetical protein